MIGLLLLVLAVVLGGGFNLLSTRYEAKKAREHVVEGFVTYSYTRVIVPEQYFKVTTYYTIRSDGALVREDYHYINQVDWAEWSAHNSEKLL